MRLWFVNPGPVRHLVMLTHWFEAGLKLSVIGRREISHRSLKRGSNSLKQGSRPNGVLHVSLQKQAQTAKIASFQADFKAL